MTSSSRKASAEDEGEHERRVRLHRVVEVARVGGHPRDVRPDARAPADRRGDDLVAQQVERAVRRRVGARARERDQTRAARCEALTSTLSGSPHLAGRERPRARAPRSPAVTGGAVTSGALTTTTAGSGPPGKAFSDAVVDLHHGQVARQSLHARVRPCAGGTRGSRARPAAARPRPPQSTGRRSTRADDRRPDARLAVARRPLREERDAAAVDAIAELGEHGRQHGQRAEQRDRDDEHRARRRTTWKTRVPIRNMPAIAVITVEAGDEHGAAGGRRRDLRAPRRRRPCARSSRSRRR